MMRLAIIAPHFPEYTVRYAAAMAQRCDVLVCVDAAQMASEYEGRDAPALPSNGRIEPVWFKTPVDLWRLARLIARFRPNVVHFQEAGGLRRCFFSACIALMTKPSALVVLTVHDPVPHEGRDAKATKRSTWVRSYVRRLADIFVVHGAYCGRLLRDSAPTKGRRIVESELGLILEPTTVRLARPGPLKLYFFGRMEAYKGVDVLLEMAEQLHDEGLPFELTIAGRGPELDRLQDRFRRLPEVTLQAGFVPPNQVISSIQDADCVILPYLSATQSAVLAAAFAGGRFVIASKVGGIPDVIEHGRNGLLVPPGDAAALASAVREVARDNGLRVKLRQGAGVTAREKLDWDRISGELHREFMAATATRFAARPTNTMLPPSPAPAGEQHPIRVVEQQSRGGR